MHYSDIFNRVGRQQTSSVILTLGSKIKLLLPLDNAKRMKFVEKNSPSFAAKALKFCCYFTLKLTKQMQSRRNSSIKLSNQLKKNQYYLITLYSAIKFENHEIFFSPHEAAGRRAPPFLVD